MQKKIYIERTKQGKPEQKK